MQTIQFKVDSSYVDIVVNLLNSIDKLNPNIIKDLSIINTLQSLSEKEIKKIVENSQRIEGYEAVSEDIQKEAKALMRKYNVEISA